MKAGVAFLFCACVYAQQASIDGLTIDSVSKQPIPGVHVRLVSLTMTAGITAAYGAQSDREGHFSIATIRPGTYILAPERTGYLYLQTSGAQGALPSIPVKPGQQLSGVKIEMSPRAIISGRVVDEFGDPMQGVSVQAIAISEKDGPRFMMPPPELPTNDRGEFRISTVGGRYYVQAKAAGNSGGGNEKPEIRPDGTPAAPYNATFYPSTTVKERGTAVEAVGGKEVSAIEIRMSRQKGLSINGIVSAAPEGNPRPYVVAQWGKSAQEITGSTSVPTDADGKFTIPNAQAAYYRLWATWYGKPPMASRVVEFQVESADYNGVELALLPGGAITGSVAMEGDTAVQKGKVRLEPASMMSYSPLTPTGGELDPQGSFKLDGVGPGKFRVKVDPLPENGYVKQAELDGAVSMDAVVDLSHGARNARLKVTVSPNGAQLSGIALDEKGERMINPLVIVMLTPSPVPQKDFQQDWMARVEHDGKYSFKSLRPGKYRIIALDALRVSGGMDALMKIMKLLEKGEEIEIKEGARIQKDVRILPKEETDAK